MSEDCKVALQTLSRRGVACVCSEHVPREATRADLVVGDFAYCREALERLHVRMPGANDYPGCLRHLLYRKVWTSTLGEVRAMLETRQDAAAVFIKPSVEIKAFSGLIASPDWMAFLVEEHSPNLQVACSEVIKIRSEYRVYCVDKRIRAVCKYMGEAPLDMQVVQSAVDTFFASPDGQNMAGCSLDMGVFEIDGRDVTGLIEVNEGFALGRYEGISADDYTDLLIARWKSLVEAQ